MRRNTILTAGLALALGTAGCQDQDQKSELTAPAPGVAELKQSGFTRDASRLKLPASVRVSDLLVPSRVVVPTKCSDVTPVINYFLDRAFEIPFPTLILLINRWADLVPSYEALIFQTKATPQYFGYNGEYNQRMRKTERDVKRFWDIESDDIQVLAMHGTVLADPSRTVPTYTSDLFLGLSEATAQTWASEVRNVMLTEPLVNGGNHPLFTFNAFAISAPELGIPDKIVMGDGILDGYKAVGFDDVALPAVFAHEFAHHIQFQRGYFEELPPGSDPSTVDDAELTRYTELMADALAAYYLTHSRGASMNRKRVEQFLQVFFQIGDCAFTSPGHHGTPIQRMRAAQFGFDVADRAHKQGHILTADQFHALFVANYTTFVAP
jgi:hypothetical protein